MKSYFVDSHRLPFKISFDLPNGPSINIADPKMNLEESYPRSPREKLFGLAQIPRMLDKANAKREGLLGEYIFPCPIDKIVLRFLGLSDQEFMDKIYKKEEMEILKWLSGIISSKETTDIDYINEKILQPKRVWWKKIYWFIFKILNPTRKSFSSWVEKVDYEEGRL